MPIILALTFVLKRLSSNLKSNFGDLMVYRKHMAELRNLKGSSGEIKSNERKMDRRFTSNGPSYFPGA